MCRALWKALGLSAGAAAGPRASACPLPQLPSGSQCVVTARLCVPLAASGHGVSSAPRVQAPSPLRRAPNSPAAAPAALGPLQLGARGYTTHFQIFISALSCLTALSCRQQLQLRGKRGFVFLSLLTAQACRPCGQSVAWPCLGCSVPRGHSAVLSGLTHSLCKTGSDLCPATSQEGSRSGPWSPQHSPIAGDGAHCPVPTALGDGRPAPLTKRDFGRPGEIGSKTIFKTT